MNNLVNSFLNQSFFSVLEIENPLTDSISNINNTNGLSKQDTSIEFTESKHCIEENFSEKTAKGNLPVLFFSGFIH